MLKLGEVQAEQNNFEASERTYRDFLEKFEKSEFAYRAQFGIGWALENRKQYDQARQTYQKVIAATNGPTAARLRSSRSAKPFSPKASLPRPCRRCWRWMMFTNTPTGQPALSSRPAGPSSK